MSESIESKNEIQSAVYHKLSNGELVCVTLLAGGVRVSVVCSCDVPMEAAEASAFYFEWSCPNCNQ